MIDLEYIWQQTQPDYPFLLQRAGIGDPASLRQALRDKLAATDLSLKQRDFAHLLFHSQAASRILDFGAFADSRLA